MEKEVLIKDIKIRLHNLKKLTNNNALDYFKNNKWYFYYGNIACLLIRINTFYGLKNANAIDCKLLCVVRDSYVKLRVHNFCRNSNYEIIELESNRCFKLPKVFQKYLEKIYLNIKKAD